MSPAVCVVRPARDIGKVITSPKSADLIEGVQIDPITLWPDDRGYFLEIQRLSQVETTQVSAALSYPGTIKAFHYHQRQTDIWTPVSGMLQIALIDMREDSRTRGACNTMYAGTLRPWQIRIPPGVAHGYKVLGQESALLVYLTDRFYDPEDEGRISYDNPNLNYDWELQHK